MSQEYADKIEIQELATRYANAMDSGKFDEWLSTWAEDGVWEGGLGRYEGKDELANLPADLGVRIEGKRHVMCNFVIDIDADSASLLCYLLVFDRMTTPALIATGVYTDKLKRINGSWKFTHRKITLDPSFTPKK